MRARRIILQGKSVSYLITSETIHEGIMDDIVGFDFFEDQELQEHPGFAGFSPRSFGRSRSSMASCTGVTEATYLNWTARCFRASQAIFSSTLSERLRRHELKTSCPPCGAPLSSPIVEFLGPTLVP
jgi:hypothetical protein